MKEEEGLHTLEAVKDFNEEISIKDIREDMEARVRGKIEYIEYELQENRIAIKSLIDLEDPIGKTLFATELDQGLELFRVSCPIGLIGIIFESRPDALVQISTLCLKSGNAVML